MEWRAGFRTVSAVAIAALTVLVPNAASAADPPTAAEAAARRELSDGDERAKALDARADGLRGEIDALRSTLVELADALRARAAELDDVETRIRSLEATERSQVDRLEVERGKTAAVLNALVGAVRSPPEVALVRPGDPLDAVRSMGALKDMLPPLKERAEADEAVIRDLRTTRDQLATERDRAREARLALDARRGEVEKLVGRREELSRMTVDERAALAKRMATLTDRVVDLRQLVERVERDRADKTARPPTPPEHLASLPAPTPETPPPAAPQPEIKTPSDATFPRPPIGGRVAVRFGQSDAFGVPARGETIVGRPGEPATAPGDGRIAFAGPFKGHGLVLIVDHGNGYHSLIAGLGRVDISVGRSVAIGEPIGALPDAEGGVPELYFELRRDGKPTNPQRGQGAPETKGRG